MNEIEIRAPLDALLAQYNDDIDRVVNLHNIFQSKEHNRAIHLFERTAKKSIEYSAKGLLNIDIDDVKKNVSSEYWGRALKLFGLNELLCADKREEWYDLIRDCKTPPFTEDVVIPTLEDMYLSRYTLLAEKVDGVYQHLSRAHKTNYHNGFYKRMIIRLVDYYACSSKSEALSDLIQSCAMLVGWNMSHSTAFNFASFITYDQPRNGKWFWLAGNLLKCRRYQCGTAHVEVHPDLAWQLNKLLADYGDNRFAIAPEFTQKRKNVNVRAPKLKDWFFQPETISFLSRARVKDNEVFLRGYSNNTEIKELLQSIGGVMHNSSTFSFDYDPSNIINTIVQYGATPEYKSHQFYPTPRSLAEHVVGEADIKEGNTVLEPSAGNGDLILRAQEAGGVVSAVEISSFRCDVIKERTGITPKCSDFLKCNFKTRFDRIIMNPPFTGNQVLAHIQHAIQFLALGGVLVSVVPVGFNADIGIEYELSQPIENEFANTSIAVRILIARQ